MKNYDICKITILILLCGIVLTITSCSNDVENNNNFTKEIKTYSDFPNVPDFGDLNNKNYIDIIPYDVVTCIIYSDVNENELNNYINTIIDYGYSKFEEFKSDEQTMYIKDNTYIVYSLNEENDMFILGTGKVTDLIEILENDTSSDTLTENNVSSNSLSLEEQNALKAAKSYIDSMPFSYTELIEQLEYEGYSNSAATYGADNCGADWYEQAKLSAQSYLESMAFSKQGLIEQLEYEGFTHDQAVYGVEANGY